MHACGSTTWASTSADHRSAWRSLPTRPVEDQAGHAPAARRRQHLASSRALPRRVGRVELHCVHALLQRGLGGASTAPARPTRPRSVISTSRLAFGCACRRRARRARSERRRSRCCAARRARADESRVARSAPPTNLVAFVGSAGHAHVASCQQHRSASVWATLLRPTALPCGRSPRQHHDVSDGRAIESQTAGQWSWTMPAPAGHAAKLAAAAVSQSRCRLGATVPGCSY